MPYKLEGTTVYVQRNGKWVILKRHKSKAQARRHLAALQANVKE